MGDARSEKSAARANSGRDVAQDGCWASNEFSGLESEWSGLELLMKMLGDEVSLKVIHLDCSYSEIADGGLVSVQRLTDLRQLNLL